MWKNFEIVVVVDCSMPAVQVYKLLRGCKYGGEFVDYD